MARWERALSVLRARVPAGSRVLDLGCAFGHGTAMIAVHYETYGLDASPNYIARARRRMPGVRFDVGTAESLPYPDRHFDAVVLLDVLEHVADEREALREVARVLRPGGTLVLSVPHTGLLRWADSINVYAWLTGENALAQPHSPYRAVDFHRHYSVDAIAGRLGAAFVIRDTHRSGLGLAEFINLALLLICKRMLRSQHLYDVLQYLYFGAYILEDTMPLGAAGYHITVTAQRVIP